MQEKSPLWVRGVKPELKEELKNIADNLGESISSLVRPKLRELRDSYPEHLRQPKKKF